MTSILKHVSILFLGISIAALPGCMHFAPMSIRWQQARFSATLPCELEISPHLSGSDPTPFGIFQQQIYTCDYWDLHFTVELGVYKDPSFMLDGEMKTKQDAEIASRIARGFCYRVTRNGAGATCELGSPVNIGNVTDVEFSFGIGAGAGKGRVRVSYPHIAVVGVLGHMEWEDLQKALDIKLPEP